MFRSTIRRLVYPVSILILTAWTAAPVRAEKAWRLTAGTLDVTADAEALELEIGAIHPGGGELRVAQPVSGYGVCRFTARWSFDRDLRRLRAGDRFRVELTIGSMDDDACGARGRHAPRLEVVVPEPGDSRYPPLFEVFDRGSRHVALKVRDVAAESGSFAVRVSTREGHADSEWRYVPVRRFAMPENERAVLETPPFEPGPFGSRVFRLPPRDDPPGQTVTLETRHQYAAKFACTFFGSFDPAIAVDGTYRTVINVRNPSQQEVRFASHVSLSREAGAETGGPFRVTPPGLLELGAGETLELDCGTVAGAFCPIDGVCIHFLWVEGFVVLDSPIVLDVTAIVTAGPEGGAVSSLDVEPVPERLAERTVEVPIPFTPIPLPPPVFEQPSERPGPVFPGIPDVFQSRPCPSQCVQDEKMIIGCDNRLQGPADDDGASQPPWHHVGRLSMGCTGTLIGPKHVLTAAHCLLVGNGGCGNDFRPGPIGFRLAQFSGGACGQPFGTHYARRVFVPDDYQNCTGDEEKRALDLAVVELMNPVPGATPMDFGHVPWSTLQHKMPFSIGYPGDKPSGTVWQTGSGNSFLPSPFRWLDGGDKGLLYATNDGVGGQSGSPVYVFQGGQRRAVGVLIGSPVAACQQGQDWVSRVTPEIRDHLENAMLFPPNGIVLDFFWRWRTLPGDEILPDVPPDCEIGVGF